MTGRTHLLIGLAAGALISPHPATIAIAGIASLLPDIDHPQAIISGWIPGGRLVGLLVGHRGPTHSLIALAALVAALMVLGAPSAWIAAGAAGYGSHLVADMTSPRGVPILWPIQWQARIPVVWRVSWVLELLAMLGALVVLGMSSLRVLGGL